MVPFADGQLRRSGSLGAGVGGLTGFLREVDQPAFRVSKGLERVISYRCHGISRRRPTAAGPVSPRWRAAAGGGRDTMTHPGNTPASLSDLPSLAQRRLDGSGFGDASRRAWSRPMTVRPFGDAYLVDCKDGTHYVSLESGDCSCEHATDERCEHVRRVAIEINLSRVPPPSAQTVECRGCDRPVAVSAADSPPVLCAECHLEPGDVVVDAEADGETPMLVVSRPGRPAEFVTVPDDGRTVADYTSNDDYPDDTPVVEVVYPRVVSTDREPRRYLFPLARLRQPGRDDRPPERSGYSTEGDSTAPSAAEQ